MAAPLTNEIVDQRIAGRPIVRLGKYVGAHTNLLWGCLAPGCGREWRTPYGNIRKGQGCPACGLKSKAAKMRLTDEAVDQRVSDKPLERLSEYVNAHAPLLWRCLATGCGHKWRSNFNNVDNGQGCPACANYGFDPAKPAIMYYVKIHGLYKAGVTNHTVKYRFGVKDYEQLKIIQQWHYAKGADALKREQNIMLWFAEDRYNGPPVLTKGGDTELFTRDILELENAA